MHCRDRGISVYIDFGNCRLYSCDIDFDKAYIQFYGLSKMECDELYGKDKNLTLEDLENIRQRYKEIKERNIDQLKKVEEEERQLLKKYYPDFVQKLEENENEISDRKKRETDEYFGILHPEYDDLSEQEQAKLEYDKSIIYENIDEINSFFRSYNKRNPKESEKKELIEYMIVEKKTDKYFKLMYPEYDLLPPILQFKLLDEHEFIKENLDEIDSYYKKCIEQNSKNQLQDDREIIQTAISNIKEKKKQFIKPEVDLTPEKMVEVSEHISDFSRVVRDEFSQEKDETIL